jgi:hypothetical protein
MEEREVIFNKHRRTFLIVFCASVSSFVLGKIFGPSINLFPKDHEISEEGFKNFRVVNTKEEMRLYDRQGNEILIFEKEPPTL